jgi:DNA-binding response OmpR family regulator
LKPLDLITLFPEGGSGLCRLLRVRARRNQGFASSYLGSDLELVKALRRVLTKPDYRLVTCADRETAVLFLKSTIPYQLLLVDLEWRDGEGLKLARFAHSKRCRKQMPIVLLAASELSDGGKTLARRAGVTDWIMKTPDLAEVAEAIKRVMSNE